MNRFFLIVVSAFVAVQPVRSSFSTTSVAEPQNSIVLQITKVQLPDLENLFPPALQFNSTKSSEKPLFQKFAALGKQLENKYGAKFCEKLHNSAYEKIRRIDSSMCTLTPEGEKVVQATLVLFQELLDGSYSDIGAALYTKVACNILHTHLTGCVRTQSVQVDKLFKKVMAGNYLIAKRSSDLSGHNEQYLLIDVVDKSLRPFALLKQNNPLYDASHMHVFENYPLYRTDMRELIGYEIDALFGFERTPVTFKVAYTTNDGKTCEGVLQAFVENAVAGQAVVSKDAISVVQALDASIPQLTALSGMIKGRGAGHYSNYLVVVNPPNYELTDLLDIDLEECMVPFNRPPTHLKIKRTNPATKESYCEDLELLAKSLQAKLVHADGQEKVILQEKLQKCKKRLATERQMITMCRLWVLGWPQNAKPFERAALLLITHPSMQKIAKQYQLQLQKKSFLELQQAAIVAFSERINKLQNLAANELAETSITKSPRDFYFEIFGGRKLYQIAKRKNYPDMHIFNSIIGCPYRHVLKDFSEPEKMPEGNFSDGRNDKSKQSSLL
jgi:hypothetical protein